MNDDIAIVSVTFGDQWIEATSIEPEGVTPRVREMKVVSIDPTLAPELLADALASAAELVRVILVEAREPADTKFTVAGVSFDEGTVTVSIIPPQPSPVVREMRHYTVPVDLGREYSSMLAGEVADMVSLAAVTRRNPPDSFMGRR